MNLVIIKYNAGNVRSLSFALERLGIHPVVTDDPEIILKADKVIFPGVGEAQNTMKYLKSRNLDRIIKDVKQPFLGICLGLQLMCEYSEEGDTECLGIFPVRVERFRPENRVVKVPHMGWNTLQTTSSPLFEGIEEGSFAYFVHSYYAAYSEEYTIASTPYIHDFSSALKKDNFYATQFHPEKSAETGARILENFLNRI